ncbi:MAG: hypothetical protein GXZ16_06960 [Spirochaetales bacterium]|nr:hypothetical protein [Spirochaetales bacterium]
MSDGSPSRKPVARFWLQLKNLFSTNGTIGLDGQICWWQLIIKMVLVLMLFLIVFGGLAFLFRDKLENVGRFVVESLGLPGVAVFAFFVDAFILPMAVDIVFPFASHWSSFVFLSAVSASSIVAGIFGYWIGRLLGRTRMVLSVTSGFSEDGKRMIGRYGPWAVAIGALTPIPYSTTVWLSGMVRIPFWKVFIACFLRIPRMILYYMAVTGAFSFFI